MLAAAYRAGKLPHALMFAGPRGIGKATLAFHLAHHLLKHPGADTRAGHALPRPIRHRRCSGRSPAARIPSVLHLTRPVNDKTKGFKTVAHRRRDPAGSAASCR